MLMMRGSDAIRWRMMIILFLIDYDEINSGDGFEVNTGGKAEHDNAMFGKRPANFTINGLVGGDVAFQIPESRGNVAALFDLYITDMML